MYNRYIPSGAAYTRISGQEEPAPRHTASVRAVKPLPGETDVQERSEEKKSTGLGGILKLLKLEELDTGDILLLLIMLFLFLEGDDMELVITLGLILILSL